MNRIHLTATAGSDGVLHLNIPVGTAGDYKIVLSVEPSTDGPKKSTPEDRGWPPGYFQRVFGSIADPAFERGDQGHYEVREALE